MTNRRFKKIASGVLTLVVIVVSVNIILSQVPARLDLTEGNVYSLTDGSINIAEKFEQPVTVELFFSRSHKELPIVIKNYATRVEELLKEYGGHASSDFVIQAVDPKPDTDAEEKARKYGVSPVRLPNGDEIYFGAAFLMEDKEVVLPYFDPRREEFLEYDVSEALLKLQESKKPVIAVASSIDLFGNPMARQPAWAFVSELQKRYEVKNIGNDFNRVEEDVDLLLVVHPKADFTEGSRFAIDQFLVKGGKAIIAVDPFSRTDLATSAQGQMGMQQRPDASSDLSSIMKNWGVTYDKSKLVGDANFASNINAGGQQVRYPFFMSLRTEAFSKDYVVTQGLDDMLFAEGGYFVAGKQEGVTFTPILETTAESGSAMAQMMQFMPPASLASQFKVEKGQKILAGLLKGKIASSFDAIPESLAAAEGGKKVTEFTKAATNPAHVLLIADVDFIADHNSVDTFNFAGQTILRPRNDNLNFVLNAVEFLSGNNDLISIRSRGKSSRPFVKVLKLQKEAQENWKGLEEKLSKEIAEVQQKITELQKQRTDGNVFTLSTAQQAEIAEFRAKEVRARKERRKVRKNLREDIESLGNVLTATNLLIVPLLVSLFGSLVFYRRNRRAEMEAGDE